MAHRDNSLGPLFRSMYDRDQEFRRKPGSYAAYRDTIHKIDSENVALVRNIIKTRGFPNENMIASGDPTFAFFPGYIVFHHYCEALSKNRSGKYNFLTDFIEAVRHGQLDPHRFAFFLSLQGDRSLLLGGWGVIRCRVGAKESPLLADKYAPERRVQIEKSRPQYGLEPLADCYRKAVFAIRNDRAKMFDFKIYNFVNTFELEDEDQYDKFIQASEPIE